MAPEILAKSSNYSFTVDVYSYGIILWELFTREEPYEDVTPKFMLSTRVVEGHRPIIPPTCPPKFADLITSCWQKGKIILLPFFFAMKFPADELMLLKDPAARPSFARVLDLLLQITKEKIVFPAEAKSEEPKPAKKSEPPSSPTIEAKTTKPKKKKSKERDKTKTKADKKDKESKSSRREGKSKDSDKAKKKSSHERPKDSKGKKEEKDKERQESVKDKETSGGERAKELRKELLKSKSGQWTTSSSNGAKTTTRKAGRHRAARSASSAANVSSGFSTARSRSVTDTPTRPGKEKEKERDESEKNRDQSKDKRGSKDDYLLAVMTFSVDE